MSYDLCASKYSEYKTTDYSKRCTCSLAYKAQSQNLKQPLFL
jgi:hypothetical protein